MGQTGRNCVQRNYLPADRCRYLFRTLLWSTVQSCSQFHSNDLCNRRRKHIGWGLCIVLRSRKASCKQALGRTRRSNRTCRRTCLPCTFLHSCTAKGKTRHRSCYLQKNSHNMIINILRPYVLLLTTTRSKYFQNSELLLMNITVDSIHASWGNFSTVTDAKTGLYAMATGSTPRGTQRDQA